MRPPTVLVAHGSPDPRSQAVVREIAAASGAIAAFLDFDEPHPVPVLKRLADNANRQVTVVPLLLTHAYHNRVDIPQVVDEAISARPNLSVRVAGPVGGEALLPAVRRGLPRSDAVVLAAAGTRDSATLAGLRELATQLGDYCGVPAMAAYAAASPTVSQAVANLRRDGAERVAVASYFIAPGVLHDRVAKSALAAGALPATPPLGACAELVTVINRLAVPLMPAAA